MGRFSHLATALVAASLNVQQCLGVDSQPTSFTDSETGITFDTWIVPDTANGGSSSTSTWGGMTFGVALPEDALTTDATEFIGYLQCPSNSTELTGWCGISFGGPMTNSLLLTAWPHEDQVLTSFRFATGYNMPELYTGDAELTQISSTVNETTYTLLFRCQNCLSWNQGGTKGSVATSGGFMTVGWCNAFPAPGNPSCPDEITVEQHDNGQGIFGAQFDDAVANPSYTEWAALATATVTGDCGSGTAPPTTTTTGAPSPTATGIPVPTAAYDYIVVGTGAGGIPVADKLSEAGNSVLLIEKGPPSSYRWGGDRRPEWLEGSNLTRFDVPGLCNEIWQDSKGIACTDTDQMAGCVLGGGTAVNAALWWRPYGLDWDYNFPEGWQASDMQDATDRLFARIPGTDTPSMDGKLYYQQGFEVLAGGLEAGGWKNVTANDVPNEKNHTFSHTPYMFSHGERGGPMATYLVSASERDNFDLWMGTAVKRVIREGGHITGVEVEAFTDGGYAGVVNVTAGSGRVILSAGTFGSAKILMRSGIGPDDQLEIVKNSADGPTMIGNDSWINLPVGYNLDDHTNTDTVIQHPDVVFYDFYEAYDNPNTTDATMYLDDRSGIFAQAAPNIGPMFWDEIECSDGVVRQLQWTARVEGGNGVADGSAMTMSQYLGRGSKGRGRMTITEGLSTVVSELPYLQDEYDVEAVVKGIKNLQAALSNVEGLTWAYPSPNTTVEDFVNDMLVSYTNRRANHWMGTAKMGKDDGRINDGSAVVDLDTRVYGTDNLFVVDASIFPGMIAVNPSSYIMIVAEHAAQRILDLKTAEAQPQFNQCGGLNYTGSFQCAEGLKCEKQNDYYWQVS
ncbi:fungal cellulose binding domain-containing protein [Xylariomycetidae sp. FL0641]|nr:fungal cellulose binding domain-containing protein [Xylariomycetidae sp. FL0641]